MPSCSFCQNPLPEPIPPRCPSCGTFTMPEPVVPPELPSEPPPDIPRAPEPEAGLPPPLPPATPPPLPPPGAEAPPGSGIPWDARDRTGFATAFAETTLQVMTRPTSFYRAMPVVGGLGSPLLYAVIAGWLGLAAAALYQAIWVWIVGSTVLPFGMDRAEMRAALAFLESWVGLVAQVVFGGIWVVISLFVAAGILHLMLLILGGARRGFEATFRVVCFAQATMLLFVIPVFMIPFCGLVPVVWSLVLYAIGLSEAHRIGAGQATAAVLLPILLFCCCCAGLGFMFAGAIASLVGHTG